MMISRRLKILRFFIIVFSSLRLIPHLVFYNFSQNKAVIEKDLARWADMVIQRDIGHRPSKIFCLVYLLTFYSEYRNLFYFRLGFISWLLSPLCRPLASLYIATREIGPGLFFQHGFSTIIAAESIGDNCWINQQVTVGFEGSKAPRIGNNVRICAGAKVIGGCYVADNCVIAANAVVIKDVAENQVVGGVPAKVLKVRSP